VYASYFATATVGWESFEMWRICSLLSITGVYYRVASHQISFGLTGLLLDDRTASRSTKHNRGLLLPSSVSSGVDKSVAAQTGITGKFALFLKFVISGDLDPLNWRYNYWHTDYSCHGKHLRKFWFIFFVLKLGVRDYRTDRRADGQVL